VILAGGAASADPLRPTTGHLGWQVDVDAFIQIDGVPWSELSQDELSPSGDVLNQETVMVRRGFLRLTGHKDDLLAVLELDGDTMAGPEARVITAYGGWSPSPLLDVRAGLMQIPFGYVTPLNVREREFAEQPTFLQAFFPGDNDAGLVARGSYGVLRYSLAAMNGAPVKDAQWKGRDPTSSYDFIGRIGGELGVLTVPGRLHFIAGVSALEGSSLHPGTPPTKDQLIWVDENGDGIVQTTELQVIPGMPGEPSQGFDHRAVGADASMSWCLQWAGRGQAFFEGAIATNLDRGVYYADPVASARNLRELGYMVGVVQHLTPNALAGVRYDYYNADRDAESHLGVDLVGVHRVYTTWAFMAAAVHGSARLMIEYDHARNPFGLATNGEPITIGDDRLVVRVQAEL